MHLEPVPHLHHHVVVLLHDLANVRVVLAQSDDRFGIES